MQGEQSGHSKNPVTILPNLYPAPNELKPKLLGLRLPALPSPLVPPQAILKSRIAPLPPDRINRFGSLPRKYF
jgi:hypothetical protein